MAMARLAAIILAGSSGGVIGAEGARRATTTPESADTTLALTAAPGPGAAPPRTGAIRRAADGMFYADALVNGTPIRFLIDTGASVVVLAPADARRLGLKTGARDFTDRIETAGGGASMRWTTLGRIAIGGAEAQGVRAAVMRDDLRISLLGQNALSQLGGITIDGDHLSLR